MISKLPNGVRLPASAQKLFSLPKALLQHVTETRKGRVAALLFSVLVFAILAWRQHRFVDHYAVNMLFWDQWDFYIPFFNDGSAWEIFTRQHGPHRQGLGFLITHLLARMSDWDSRWDAFAVSFAMMAAAALSVWLAVKHGFRLAGALIVSALLFLNLRQYEIFVGASNLSHGALPVLMLVGACLCWFIHHAWLRAALLSFLTFMLIFTGFGIFAGLVIPCVLLADGMHVWRFGDRKRLLPIATTLSVIAIAWVLFAQNYVFAPAVDNFKFPHDKPWEYLTFMGLMLTNAIGIPGRGASAQIIGSALCLGLVTICLFHTARLLRKNTASMTTSRVIFTLTAFALIYAANTAVGRVSLGMAGALASRYITLMLPAFLGMFLQCTYLPDRLRRPVIAIFILGVATGMLIPHKKDWRYIRWFHDGRLAWRQAYLETHDEVIANERSGFPVYPTPGKITQRLQFLEERRLNLFNENGTPGEGS